MRQFIIDDNGQYIMYGVPYGQYTEEDYEYEKSVWPVEDLPKTDSEDKQLFEMCRSRRDLLFRVQSFLELPEIVSIPSNPSIFEFIKHTLRRWMSNARG